MLLYRIARTKFANDLSGISAKLYGGRWNSAGFPALYTSATRSLALLENMVHSIGIVKDDFSLITLFLPEEYSILNVELNSLPQGWNDSPASNEVVTIGNNFLAARNFVGMAVPSAIIPGEYNVILNPEHEAYKNLQLLSIEKLSKLAAKVSVYQDSHGVRSFPQQYEYELESPEPYAYGSLEYESPDSYIVNQTQRSWIDLYGGTIGTCIYLFKNRKRSLHLPNIYYRESVSFMNSEPFLDYESITEFALPYEERPGNENFYQDFLSDRIIYQISGFKWVPHAIADIGEMTDNAGTCKNTRCEKTCLSPGCICDSTRNICIGL